MRTLLTKRQREILKQMRDRRDEEDGELCYERGRGFLGLDPVAPRTVFALLRLAAISSETPMNDIGTPGHIERYTINETGEQLLTCSRVFRSVLVTRSEHADQLATNNRGAAGRPTPSTTAYHDMAAAARSALRELSQAEQALREYERQPEFDPEAPA